MKLLLPPGVAAVVAGRAGAVARDIEEHSGARLDIREVVEPIGFEGWRLLTAWARDEEALNNVASRCLQVVAEVAKRGVPSAVKDEQLQLCMLLPRALLQAFKGPRGADARQLCEESGAMLKIRGLEQEGGPACPVQLHLHGTARALEHVVADVNRLVRESVGQPWAGAWAAQDLRKERPSSARSSCSRHRAPADEEGASGSERWALLSDPGLGLRARGEAKRSSSRRVLQRKAWRGGAPVDVAGRPLSAQEPSAAVKAGREMVAKVMGSLPLHVLEEARGFAVSCQIPQPLVAPLAGRGGEAVEEVEASTKTRICFGEAPSFGGHCSMSIAGPLLNVCSAYMLMMKRYLDAEQSDLAEHSS